MNSSAHATRGRGAHRRRRRRRAPRSGCSREWWCRRARSPAARSRPGERRLSIRTVRRSTPSISIAPRVGVEEAHHERHQRALARAGGADDRRDRSRAGARSSRFEGGAVGLVAEAVPPRERQRSRVTFSRSMASGASTTSGSRSSSSKTRSSPIATSWVRPQVRNSRRTWSVPAAGQELEGVVGAEVPYAESHGGQHRAGVGRFDVTGSRRWRWPWTRAVQCRPAQKIDDTVDGESGCARPVPPRRRRGSSVSKRSCSRTCSAA